MTVMIEGSTEHQELLLKSVLGCHRDPAMTAATEGAATQH